MTSFGILFLLAMPSFDVELTTLDGQSIAGPLEAWTADTITVAEQSVPLDNVHRISADDAVSISGAEQVIVLADESQLIVGNMSRSVGMVDAAIGEQPIRFDAKALKAIRFAPVEDRYSKTWQELLTKDQRDDLFVRERGESLDHVSCVVGDISADGVALRVGSRDVTVPIDRTFGVIFAGNTNSQARLAGKVTLTNGSSIMASRLAWSEETLSIDAVQGFSLAIPADQLAEVDLAAGRITMLSELEPRSVSYSPFGDNYDEYAWKLRRNTNALGDRLRVDSKRRNSGLWIHSGTTAVYSLPSRAKQFTALVGIDEIEAPGVPVRLEILVDGRKSYDAIIEPQNPQSIEIDVADARQLTIIAATTKPDEHGIREHLAVVDARLILE